MLPKYAVANLSVSRDLGRHLEVFAAVQNMFDEEYFVGSLPTLVGPPRLVSGGLKIQFQPAPTSLCQVRPLTFATTGSPESGYTTMPHGLVPRDLNRVQSLCSRGLP